MRLKQGFFVLAALLIGACMIGTVRGEPPKGADGAAASSSNELQKLLDGAKPGDTIVLKAGKVYAGTLVLPVKEGNAPITITSSDPPRAGVRVGPDDASRMPRIVAPGRNQPALITAPGAHHYRVIGVEFAPANAQAVVSDLIKLGDGSSAQNKSDLVPHDLTLDRCYIHGLPGADLKRGVALNSASTTITCCYISECKGVGYDSQAICGWNGPGPFTITDNYLEGAGENVMFGGSDPAIDGLIPSDILIEGNTLSKPLSWRVGDRAYCGIHYSVKNLFEIKNAQRVTIKRNVFENCWVDGQVGFAISLKAVMQNGRAPWSACQDVQFTNNIVRHSAAGVNIAGQTNTAARLYIARNKFEDINGPKWGGAGVFLQISNADSVTFDGNTSDQTGSIINVYGKPATHFVFTGNMMPHNAYGVKGSGTGVGTGTLNAFFPGCAFSGNTFTGGARFARSYPPGNSFP